ncbi:FAD binding domain-containing protein [Geodermatophilus ruber]|uniref:Carbon-monoxide dehydrogenase medium subunit n=1 Tax=Geodermatophilus ruber TaxID=504800 RepID=A0A1I4BYP8_9ACTN|nr:FAD binding domain-containing protein [Geodermatophilus ruber]SFK73924.1 carbon-monoxide dehydrogenase medium subunit [Geodermatophilus ruber]
MIRTPLRYHRPRTPDEASALLVEHRGDVAVLGGGTQLLPQMNRDQVHVGHLVDLRGLGLRRIEVTDDQVVVEALVTYADVLLSRDLSRAAPHLRRVAHGVTGGRQIRNTGTLAGSACFAMPGSDMPAALVGIDAILRLHGPDGAREVRAADFYVDAFTTVLRPGEFVLAITIPRTAARTGYCKVKHSSGSWPIATATARRLDGSATVTLGSVHATPLHVDVSDLASNGPVDRAALADRVRSALPAPWTDVLAPGDYRARIAGVVAARAFSELEGVPA